MGKSQSWGNLLPGENGSLDSSLREEGRPPGQEPGITRHPPQETGEEGEK